MVGEVRRAPDRGPAHRAPHPAMAEGRCAGGWIMDAARGGDATGWERLTLIGQSVPPLCVRPVGPPVAEEAGARRGDRRALGRRLHCWIRAPVGGRAVPWGTQGATEEVWTGTALELHSEKTRLIEFGRHAAERRKRRGQSKPETF